MTIPSKVIAEYADSIERGETIRVDHSDCPAGEDTRRRLYLTRPASSAGVVLAFCQNCQEHGVLRHGVARYRMHDLSNATYEEEVEFKVPDNLVPDPDDWPIDAHVWRHKKQLTKQQCIRAHIQYHPTYNRIYLPQYRRLASDGTPFSHDELMGYQLRHLNGSGPKYLSAIADRDTKPFTRINYTPRQGCILVEDLASGLAIAHAVPGIGVVVNYGVKIVPETLYANDNCVKYAVWLDNDGDHVEKQAAHIARTWELITGKQTVVVKDYKDPKHYKDEEIQRIIREEIW